MDPSALAIPIAFILLSAVLCLLLIGSKWSWWQKLALIVIVPGFGLVVWHSIASYKGWPTSEEPPDRSIIVWAVVREPDPARGDDGAVYLWLMPYDDKVEHGMNPLDYVSPGNEPRAYNFSYSRLMHMMLDGAKQSMQQGGGPMILDLRGRKGRGGSGNGSDGEGEPGDGSGDGESGDGSGENGNGSGGTGGYQYPDDRQDFHIYELPPGRPPLKMPE